MLKKCISVLGWVLIFEYIAYAALYALALAITIRTLDILGGIK